MEITLFNFELEYVYNSTWITQNLVWGIHNRYNIKQIICILLESDDNFYQSSLRLFTRINTYLQFV